jgi:DNA-directed RNA polymerase specialized sigma24 family protein
LSRLEQLDPRKARILELRVYLGCTAEDTAEILAISKATVDRELTLARAWLCRELRPDEQPAPRRSYETATKPRPKSGS